MARSVVKIAANFVREGTVTEKRAPVPTVVWRDTLEVVVTSVSFHHTGLILRYELRF